MAVENVTNSTSLSYIQQSYGKSSDPQQVQQAQQISDQQAKDQKANLQKVSPHDTIKLNFTTTTKNLDTARAIEQMHGRLNELAKGVRETNEVLSQATDKAVKMETALQGIIKNYPPFPMESSRRQEILMSYATIRKEIEKMMIPQPPQPVYVHVKQMWDELFSENGQILSSAIPKLDTTSSDASVKSGADQLGRTSEKIAAFSDAMTQSLVKGA